MLAEQTPCYKTGAIQCEHSKLRLARLPIPVCLWVSDPVGFCRQVVGYGVQRIVISHLKRDKKRRRGERFAKE